jgi:all-trans-8'-apo-beta-carotenal 15,15'-oxygenase
MLRQIWEAAMATPKEKIEEIPFRDPQMAHVRGFEALEEEYAYTVPNAEIGGTVPETVRGTFFRIGPGRNRIGNDTFGHWFDGDGMMHAITFTDEGAWYRNRYVRTPKYLAETKAQRIVKRSFGHNAPGGMLKNAARLPANCANTSLAWHAGKLLALWEGGRPWALDPVTLETEGEYDFHGKLGRFDTFSAHGKHDPATGCYFNHGMAVGPRGPQVNLYRINADGELDQRGRFSLPFNGFIHDFAFAGDYLVYFLHPVGFKNPLPFLAGLKSINDLVGYHPEWGMEAVVVDKNTLKPVKRFQLDPFVVFHFGNCWQDGDRLKITLMRFEDFSVNELLSDVFHARNDQGGRLWRYELDLASGEVSDHELGLPLAGEFPQWDMRFSGKPTRFVYANGIAENGTPGFFNAVQRLDTETGETVVHDFGPGRFASEAMFIPEGEQEGDGYLGAVVYDARDHCSEVVLLDARDEALSEVARVPLRNHVPFGFHCGYVEEAFLPEGIGLTSDL